MIRACICVASGPSLNDHDVKLAIDSGLMIAVCNDNYLRVPNAQLLYAQDARWWDHHYRNIMKRGFKGEMWAGSATVCNKYNLRHAMITKTSGWAFWVPLPAPQKQLPVAGGALSGYQLVNLVGNRWKPEVILLLGYDHQETNGHKHWFGNHPHNWPNVPDLPGKLKFWDHMKEQLPNGLQIINVSRETAITSFPRMKIKEGIELALSLKSRTSATQ